MISHTRRALLPLSSITSLKEWENGETKLASGHLSKLLAQTAKQQTRQGAGMPNLLEPLREAKLSCGSRDRAARTQQTGRGKHLS